MTDPTYFSVSPEKQKQDAEERLGIAVTMLDLAIETLKKDNTRANEISVKAATRLVKETLAEYREWDVG